jgi:hypothetical protein
VWFGVLTAVNAKISILTIRDTMQCGSRVQRVLEAAGSSETLVIVQDYTASFLQDRTLLKNVYVNLRCNHVYI